jgi:hypothetical protein
MDRLPAPDTLNILPLGSYDMLIGMDWLVYHKTKLDRYHKTLECVNEGGRKVTLQGIQNPISVRKLSALQMKKIGVLYMQYRCWNLLRMIK